MKREKISGGIHTVQQLLADGHVLRLYVADNKKSKNLTALVGEAQARGVPVETVALYEIEMMLPGVRHQGVLAYVAPVAYVAVEEIIAAARREGRKIVPVCSYAAKMMLQRKDAYRDVLEKH